MMMVKLLPVAFVLLSAIAVGKRNYNDPPPCAPADEDAMDILDDYRWADSTTDTATVSWRQRSSLPTVPVTQIVLVADTTVCRRAVNAYNAILASRLNDTRESITATVIKWSNTRYAVSDSVHNSGEWTLHLVTDSSFTQVLSITRR